MAFGDCLLKKLHENEFMTCSENKNSPQAFWVMLRDAAVEDIKCISPSKIDSDVAISFYYDILSVNTDYLPDFICDIVPSVKQERFRVANRNLFSSNAFHSEGLENIKGIYSYKIYNSKCKGEKIVYEWVGDRK